MKTASLIENKQYNEEKPKVEMLLETAFSKEIRILFKAGQIMKSHKAPFPIVVEVFEGNIEFGVLDKSLSLKAGNLITLDANIPHDLKATADSTVRLTLSKGDQVERVKSVEN